MTLSTDDQDRYRNLSGGALYVYGGEGECQLSPPQHNPSVRRPDQTGLIMLSVYIATLSTHTEQPERLSNMHRCCLCCISKLLKPLKSYLVISWVFYFEGWGICVIRTPLAFPFSLTSRALVSALAKELHTRLLLNSGYCKLHFGRWRHLLQWNYETIQSLPVAQSLPIRLPS